MACIGNMPSFKYVTVENLVITYNGTPYPIKAFTTNKKYIVWNIDRPYQLEDVNVRPNSSLLEYLIVINDNGKPTIVEHDELLYSFDQNTNGSNLVASTEYNALKTEVKDTTKKFNLISNTVDGMSQIIGTTEELEDGSIIYNLNKVKSDSKSYGIALEEIQTKIDDKYEEIKPIILNDLIEYLKSVSEFKLSFTDILEDTLITEEELILINTSRTNMLDKSTKLQAILDDLKVIIDSVNDTEKSQLVIDMKNKLLVLQDALISIYDSYLQDSKISGEEKTNIIQKVYELTTYIGIVQNTCNNITVNSQAGVVYSIENELLMLKDKTTSSIKELTRETNDLTQTVSSQTSDIRQMKNAIELKVDQTEVNDTMDSKLKDYSTTTQMNSAIKLKAESVLTTVSNTYISTNDADNNYATKSSLRQTSEDIVTRFAENGGYNLIYNGDFRRNGDMWEDSGQNKSYPQNGLSCPNGRGVIMSGQIDTTILLQQSVTTNTGRQSITFSYYTYVTSSGLDGKTNPYRKAEVRLTYTDGTFGYFTDGDVSTFDKWEKKSHTISPPKAVSDVRIGLYNRDTTRTVYYSAVMVNIGDISKDWTPNPNEIYDGITKIDKDGVTVKMIDGEGSKGYSTLSYEGVATYDGNGNIKSWFSDDSAYIKELNVDIINNPYILQSKPRPTNWYVGQNETGDGTGRSSDNKANSINSVLEYIKSNYGCYLNRQDLIINLDNISLNENILISGWLGSGTIKINMGQFTTFNGYIRVEENVPYVILEGNGTGYNVNDGCKWYREDGNASNVALFVRSSNVYCRNFRVHRGVGLTSYGNDFAAIEMASNLQLYNMDIVKYSSIIRGASGATAYIGDCRGDVSVLSSSLSRCTLISKNALPIFNTGANINQSGCSIDTNGWTLDNNSLWYPKKVQPSDPEPPTPPSKSWNWVEKTFYFKLSSTTEGSGSATTNWSDKWGQGSWGSYKSHRGHAVPTESISSWCSVGSNIRNISMILTMTRLNTNHGYYGAVPIPKLKQKDGSYWDSGVSFALGNKKSISLPNGIVSGVSDGTLSELTMWAGASATDYSQYNGVSLKVKCEKYY